MVSTHSHTNGEKPELEQLDEHIGQINGNGSEQKAAQSGFGFDNGDLGNLCRPPKFDNLEEQEEYNKEHLVTALRIFARNGYDFSVAGHLTVRSVLDEDCFWVNPFGRAFSQMSIPDLILVEGSTGKVIKGGKPGRRIVNLAGFVIHHAIHVARPDVNAICHAHTPYGKAFSTLGKTLPFTTQDSCMFYNDIALLKDFGGPVIKGTEGASISAAIGEKKAIILQNHGILTTGKTLDAAVAWFITLEKACETALLSQAAGTPIAVDVPQAEFTAKELGSDESGFFQASPYFQVIEESQGHEYLRRFTNKAI